jgi:hypothetical protein
MRENPPSIERMMEVLNGERARPITNDNVSDIDAASNQNAPITAEASTEAVTESGSNTLLETRPPALAEAAKLADTEQAQMSALLKAIVDPDIFTARVHRDRAIDLRWVLRDIRSDRLKWWPVKESDLRALIEMGLVEMRDDRPILTSAGADAIV